MVDLTSQEIKALLWHIDIVDHAYGNGHPEGSTIDSAKGKLLDALNDKKKEHRA